MAQLSGKLLDFETSITNQMTASLMIGKRLNFNQARILSSQGKMSQAIKQFRQQMGIVDLDNLNWAQAAAIQQMGISIKQLKQMQVREKLLAQVKDKLSAQQQKLIDKYGQTIDITEGMTAAQVEASLKNAATMDDMRS